MSKKSKNQHPIPQAVLEEFKYVSDGEEGLVEDIGAPHDAYTYFSGDFVFSSPK